MQRTLSLLAAITLIALVGCEPPPNKRPSSISPTGGKETTKAVEPSAPKTPDAPKDPAPIPEEPKPTDPASEPKPEVKPESASAETKEPVQVAVIDKKPDLKSLNPEMKAGDWNQW